MHTSFPKLPLILIAVALFCSKGAAEDSPEIKELRALAARFYKAQEQCNRGELEKLLTPDAVIVADSLEPTGAEPLDPTTSDWLGPTKRNLFTRSEFIDLLLEGGKRQIELSDSHFLVQPGSKNALITTHTKNRGLSENSVTLLTEDTMVLVKEGGFRISMFVISLGRPASR